MSREIHKDAQVTVTVDAAAGLVRYTRSREAYPSIETLRSVHAALGRALKELPPGDMQLLLDMREAPPRNDEAFESEVNRALQVIMPRFTSHAVIVRTAVGRRGGVPFAHEMDEAWRGRDVWIEPDVEYGVAPDLFQLMARALLAVHNDAASIEVAVNHFATLDPGDDPWHRWSVGQQEHPDPELCEEGGLSCFQRRDE